jgi:hypothetical protein
LLLGRTKVTTAWSALFLGAESDFVLRAKLGDGTIIAGYFGSESVVSAASDGGDVYLERQVAVDANGALLLDESGQAQLLEQGLLIKREDVLWIETYSIEEASRDGTTDQ